MKLNLQNLLLKGFNWTVCSEMKQVHKIFVRIAIGCALLTVRQNCILYRRARNFAELLHCALSCVYELRI